MTHLHVDSISPAPTPVADARARLSQLIDDARRLQADAEYLSAEIFSLKSELEEVIEEIDADSDKGVLLDTALDAATWLHTATDNADAEFNVLVDDLQDIVDGWSAD